MNHIDYSTDTLTVTCKNGTQHQGSRVIVAAPLARLKDGTMEFNPPLPQDKTEAINSLGIGQIEKVTMEHISCNFCEVSNIFSPTEPKVQVGY